MKINRFVALALIAVLAVAAMAEVTTYAAAQGNEPPTPLQDCGAEDDDAAEAAEAGPDTDAIEEEVECGQQDSDADDVEEEFAGEAEEDNAEGPDQSITGSALDTASAAALAYTGGGRVTGTELSDEEGYYEVEVTFDDGHQVDVHLDENFNVLDQVADGD
jgi:uncharacterized membrane protein YkoI